MGADVMRWQYCAQPPNRNLLFGFGPAHEIKRKLLTLWNSTRVPRRLREIEGFRPSGTSRRPAGASARSTAGLSRGRASSSPRRPTAYEAYLTVDVIRAFDAFVDDLSNWYIRRSRRRFWDGDEAALRTLWFALVQGSASSRR